MKSNPFKNFTAAAMLLACIAGFNQTAHALVFSDVFTFNPNTVSYGSSQSSGFSWSHNILDNIGGNNIADITILDATLTVNHDNTGENANAELWTLTGLGNLNINNDPISTVFNFLAASLADLQADGIFNVFLTESTSGADNLLLFTATLAGNYALNNPNPDPDPDPNATNVPEPLTMTLVASGLGLAALKRRFAKK